MIYDRFRCFLNKKAICMIPEGIYHGLSDNYYFHKNLVKYIKVHLYNNRKLKPKNKEQIPDDNNHEVFWALSKKFTWEEINKLITKMDKLNIDFDANLDDIKQELLMHIDINPKLGLTFKKLLKRIDKLILNFNENVNEETSSK
ncbi:type II secretion system protein E [Powai lake megavirus]|uniref:Type II secretion system protein E n=1 Tax=Powai lake megavirus TaxID=1842663 RepID=A0A167R0K4_9VIRU|nr:type II secretion system protein E [Powai lake megavirus]ANB50168.1 type II secretion system protein E [Powai lake megavirus]